MATNLFKVFDENKTNIQSDAEYLSDADRVDGVASGQARSVLHNKLYRQVSTMAYALGEFIKGKGQDANDSSDTTLASNLATALNYENDLERGLQKEPTGFTNNDAIVCTYDSTGRTITLTGTFEAYYRGVKVAVLTNGWISDPHSTTLDQTYFLRYDGTNFIFDENVFSFDNLLIAVVQYGTNDKIAIKETHGFMPWESHFNAHFTVGAYKTAGGTLTTGSWSANSTTAANRRPLVEQTTIYDEDLKHTINALTTETYTQKYLVGTGAVRTFVVGAADILPVTADNPYYNQNIAGTWSQTPFPNNAYGAVWLTAIPVTSDAGSQSYRYIWTQPQTVSTTLATIRALTPSDINIGESAALVSEFVFIVKVIVRFTNNNWVITEVQNLTGNRFNQTGSPQGAYLTIVTSDATLTGDGTSATPLAVATPLVYETSTANIKMDGSVSVGALTTVARADHIHASDTSRASLTGIETLTNKTLTSPKINEDVVMTATATELNVLDGIPATLTATELGYVDGVTSAIQTQLDGSVPLSSYIGFVSNVSVNFNGASFVPCSATELVNKKIFLGYQIAKYMNDSLSDITLTSTEITQLSTKNTWYDICGDPVTKAIVKRSASFLAKIATVPWASYVMSVYATTASFIAQVNSTYTTSFTTIDGIKADLTVMNQLVNNNDLCILVMSNADIELAFLGTAGANITLLQGSGNFTVPAGVTVLNYSMVGGGANGAAGQGKILKGSMTVTPGANLAYAVAANNTGAATTFNGLSTASGATISNTNCGLLARASTGITGTSSGTDGRGGGGGGGYGGAGGGAGVYSPGGTGGGAGGAGGAGAGAGGCGGYAGGSSSSSGGAGPIFLGDSALGGLADGANGVGLGTIAPYTDAIYKILNYRALPTSNILSAKIVSLAIFGGAGGGGGYQGAGGTGAGGAAGGATSAVGKGAGGVLFLMW